MSGDRGYGGGGGGVRGGADVPGPGGVIGHPVPVVPGVPGGRNTVPVADGGGASVGTFVFGPGLGPIDTRTKQQVEEKTKIFLEERQKQINRLTAAAKAKAAAEAPRPIRGGYRKRRKSRKSKKSRRRHSVRR